MLEQVYDTLRAIIFNELPKNANGDCVVYDRVVQLFLFGDQQPIPNTPAIVIRGSTSKPEKIAQNLNKLTHTITIQTFSQNDNKEISERVSQEMAREIFTVLLSHRRIWVLVKCPICNVKIMSPLHFTIVHESLFAPYVETVTTDLTNTWLETHPSYESIPSFIDSGIARAAYDLLNVDVSNNVTVSGLTPDALARIIYYENDKRQVVRLLYNANMTEVKPSDDGMGQQILHSAQFSLMLEELVQQPAYGPDNVPTGFWS